MNALTVRIKDRILSEGADLVGVAPISRFDGLPARQHPASIFPETRSVVVAGFMLPRGDMRGIEEATYFGSAIGISAWLPWFYHQVAGEFETNGWEVVPVYNNFPDEVRPSHCHVPADSERPLAGLAIDIPDAALRAGLGDIGLHGLFLSPEFGTLQLFMLLLTDAELTPTDIGPTKVCDECGDCVRACPLGAINADRVDNRAICGREIKVAAVNLKRCQRCQNGVRNAASPSPDRYTSLCGRACLVHLEEKGALGNKWANKFRKREPWVMVDDVVMADYTEQNEHAING